MTLKLEYVASGIAHTRLTNNELAVDPDSIKDIQTRISATQNRYNHNVSFLFNGYTEERLGAKIYEYLRDSLHNIYADSGGLQMITLGHVVTEELKKQVYDVQSRYSSVALSFDEIPLIVTAHRSTFHDTKSRYFDKRILDEKAKQSGQNLLAQINFFKDKQKHTKPLLIIQGNDIETYQRWFDIIVDEVGEDNLQYVGGISSGAAALGQGMLEDVKRFFILAHLNTPVKFNYVHVLGVGSTTRLVPLIILYKMGFFQDTVVSYDSTTHTSGLSRGFYFYEDSLMKLGRHRGRNFDIILNDINSNLEEIGVEKISAESLYNQICVNDTVRYKESSFKRYSTIYSFLLSQIINFMRSTNRMLDDENHMVSTLNKKKHILPMLNLKHCRDWNDFVEWENRFRRDLDSKAVPNKEEETTSLRSFL